jgi:hypothetical protein
MKFVNITRFAAMKKCSRETVYKAAKRGKIDIDRNSGMPVIYLTDKNLNWIPGENTGRPRKESVGLIASEINKEIGRNK